MGPSSGSWTAVTATFSGEGPETVDVDECEGDRTTTITGGEFRGHTRGLLVSVPGENYWPPMGTFPCPPSPTTR